MEYNWLIYIPGWIVGLNTVARIWGLNESNGNSEWVLTIVVWTMTWIWICLNFVR